MRRGLIHWSKEELPVAALDARVAKLQAAMREEKIGVVLVYSSFAQPAATQWLANFLPYWSEAIVAVLPHGVPVAMVALTKRVHPWIREVAHLKELITAPKVGASAVAFIKEHLGEGLKVGIVELDGMPWSAAEAIVTSEFGPRVVDASAMFAKVRQPGDAYEKALTARAEEIANAALNSIPTTAKTAAEITSAIESSARLAGAEEVLQRIAPDLSTGTSLARMDGDQAIGSRYAVELSMAYKGAWVRVAKTVAKDSAPASWKQAQSWFDGALHGSFADGKLPSTPPGKLVSWSLEASIGVYPLTVIAGEKIVKPAPLPSGSSAVLSVHLQLADGHWFASAPVNIA